MGTLGNSYNAVLKKLLYCAQFMTFVEVHCDSASSLKTIGVGHKFACPCTTTSSSRGEGFASYENISPFTKWWSPNAARLKNLLRKWALEYLTERKASPVLPQKYILLIRSLFSWLLNMLAKEHTMCYKFQISSRTHWRCADFKSAVSRG